jgi:predicted amidohydrolase
MTGRAVLLQGGRIISMDDSIGHIPRGDVLIEDGKIVKVAEAIDAPNAEVFDASNMVVANSEGLRPSHSTRRSTSLSNSLRAVSASRTFASSVALTSGDGTSAKGSRETRFSRASRRRMDLRVLAVTLRAVAYNQARASSPSGTRSILRQAMRKISATASSASSLEPVRQEQ